MLQWHSLTIRTSRENRILYTGQPQGEGTPAGEVGNEGGTYSKNNRLALGLSDYLDDFASENNAHTWKDFADPVN